MLNNLLQKIKEIHSSDYKFVIVSSGGGSNAIASLLEVPGASNSVLEAYIPYAKESLDFYLLKKPDFYCSKETALRMAAKAYSAAKKIDAESSRKKLLGVAITAALATNYKKRGDHKFHVALQTEDYSKSISCVLEKGARSREEEEQLVTEYVVNLISESLGLDFCYPKIKEQSVIDRVEAKEGWQELMREEISFITREGQKPKLIFPGSFNPIHDGHKKMSKLAEDKVKEQAFFEICIQNADKPPLSYHQIESTLSQFTSGNWLLTKAGKFSDKSKIFPEATFIIGADTLMRILDEKFYSSHKAMIEEFEIFNENNTRFLVFGRIFKGNFITLSDIELPSNIADRFEGFGEDIFRDDISSTTLRVARGED
jgi:hypothetical protein